MNKIFIIIQYVVKIYIFISSIYCSDSNIFNKHKLDEYKDEIEENALIEQLDLSVIKDEKLVQEWKQH
jgi:hypothetical protein